MPPVDSVDVELPAEARSAAVARAAVRAFLLASHADPDTVDRAVLLTSEVVTNAILHARTTLRLTVGLTADQAVVRVHDRVALPPRRRHYGEEAGTGRGMHLVEALSDDWGVDQSAGGKSVWFALSRQPTATVGAEARQYG